jgi:Ca2+/Na+ antiporter
MNIFKQLYCSQYYELKPKNLEESARKYGTNLLTIAFVFYSLSISFLLVVIFPNFKDFVENILKEVFGRKGSRTIGQIIAAIYFVFCYFVVKMTLGNKKRYEKVISEFILLDDYTQQKFCKNSLFFFITSIALFVVSISLFLIIV